MLGISSYLADYPVRIDLRGLRQRGLQKARKRGHRRVSDDSANAFIEALLLRRKKARRRTGASSDQIYPAVITETSLSKFEPCIQVDALHKTPCEGLSAAHAVRSHMCHDAVALDLAHHEARICSHLGGRFVVAVHKDNHVAACAVRRRPVIARQPASVKSIGANTEPLVMECIEPVLASAVDRAPVYLLGGSVDLRKRSGPLEELFEDLIRIR